jgi:hypothetical protein
VDIGIGLVEQNLEAGKLAIVHGVQMRIRETAQQQVHFEGAAAPGTVVQALGAAVAVVCFGHGPMRS